MKQDIVISEFQLELPTIKKNILDNLDIIRNVLSETESDTLVIMFRKLSAMSTRDIRFEIVP